MQPENGENISVLTNGVRGAGKGTTGQSPGKRNAKNALRKDAYMQEITGTRKYYRKKVSENETD